MLGEMDLGSATNEKFAFIKAMAVTRLSSPSEA
jgi:hypothetical protein